MTGFRLIRDQSLPAGNPEVVMERVQPSEFSGVSGQVVYQALGVTSMISGLFLGVVLAVGGYVLLKAGAPAAVTPFVQIVLALAMARFALNGRFGEWNGTVFSGTGGSWATVLFVTGRYLALTALWFVPLMMFGSIPRDSETWALMMMSGGGQALGVFGIYFLAMTLAPPVLLIVAVSADGFGDLFSPDHWRRLFGGRFTDLFAVYSAYVGGFVMVTILSIPFVMLPFMANPRLGMFTLGLTVLFLFGVSANLMGRLCGFFACGDLGLSEPTVSADPVRPTPPVSRPALATAEAPASVPLSGVAPIPAPTLEMPLPPSAVPASPASIDPSATIQLSPDALVQQLAAGAALAEQAPVQAAAAATQVAPASPAVQAQRPPLLDGEQRVAALTPRSNNDAESVIPALEELNRAHAPDPHVLHALAVARFRAGQIDASVQVGTEAIALCLERGHDALAAQVFKELRPQMARLGLDRDQLVVIAASLAKTDDLAAAAKAYSVVIAEDAADTRAVKGLLAVADDILHKKLRAEAAAKVYRYVLAHCSTSPLAEYMHHGLEEAERKISDG